MNAANRGASRGFTVVELIMAMVIAGILTAVAAPRMMDRDAFQARSGASEVRAALRYAQKLAMAKNREVCVVLAATSVTLRVNPSLTTGAACSQAVTRPGQGDPYVVALPASASLAPTLGFRFDGQGRPSPNVDMNLTVGGTVPVLVAREVGRVQ
jgi:MSHA pilin protein MshC